VILCHSKLSTAQLCPGKMSDFEGLQRIEEIKTVTRILMKILSTKSRGLPNCKKRGGIEFLTEPASFSVLMSFSKSAEL